MLRYCLKIVTIRAALTIVMSAVFLLGVTIENHAAQHSDTGAISAVESASLQHASVQADIVADSKRIYGKDTLKTCSHPDCANPLSTDWLDCIDDCCDGFCHSFLVKAQFDLSQFLPSQPKDLANERLTDLSVAPLPFPPRT